MAQQQLLRALNPTATARRPRWPRPPPRYKVLAIRPSGSNALARAAAVDRSDSELPFPRHTTATTCDLWDPIFGSGLVSYY
eukprot:2078843-Rhodomonas_salina.1